jgi:shikimate kinase
MLKEFARSRGVAFGSFPAHCSDTCGKAVIRSFAEPYGISVNVSTDSPLTTGLGGGGAAEF